MITIKIITPLGLYKEGVVEAVNVTTLEGQRTILPNHIPIVAMLATCKCQLKEQGKYNDYALAGGLLQMANNELRILTDAIEERKDIDLERAKKARDRAEKRLTKHTEEVNHKRAEIALAKAINRIHVYGEH